jgi:hypothetical protein
MFVMYIIQIFIPYKERTKAACSKFSDTLITSVFQLLTELLYNRPFFPKTKYVNGPLQKLCKTGAVTQGLCTNILFQIGGFNSHQINQVSSVKTNITKTTAQEE